MKFFELIVKNVEGFEGSYLPITMEEKLNSFPKISIVLPTYNGYKYIKQSIDSCLNQTYKNIELIIVDDGSSIEISEIVKSYQDERIRYVRHEKNLGLPQALNTGFAASTGEYLTWTSDDNFYSPEAIESMIKVLQENRKIDFVYVNYYLVDEEENVIQHERVVSAKKLYLWNCIGPCFLYTRKVYEKIGKYNPEFFLIEDYEYWFRVRKEFKMEKLNKWLYYYRLHTSSLSAYKREFSSHEETKYKEMIEKTRDKYISLAERYHLYSEKYFQKGDFPKARKFAIKSLLSNPFLNLDVWKLLIAILLGPWIMRKIRKVENVVFKAKNVAVIRGTESSWQKSENPESKGE